MGQETKYKMIEEKRQWRKDRLEAYKYPGTLKKAREHERATKFGKFPTPSANYHKQNMCACCQEYLHREDFGFCEKKSTLFMCFSKISERISLFFFPTGVSLFFAYIKVVIFILCMRIIALDLNIVISTLSSEESYCP